MKKIVFEKKPAELKFVGVESENEWKAIVVKDHKKDEFRVINLAENENYPAWLEKSVDKIISGCKEWNITPYSFTSNIDLVNWAMGDDSVQKFPINDTIHIDDVTDEMYVGIVWTDGKKSFCLTSCGSWIGKSVKQNSLLRDGEWETPTLKDYVVQAKKTHLSTAYVFPTAKELLQWTITD
jgi:hypothetical protein